MLQSKIIHPNNTLGQLLRKHRESNELLLRQVAAALEMDTALLSKFERNERTPNKKQVITFARFYKLNADDLILAWLSDKIANEVKNEDLAKEALKLAEKKIEFLKTKTYPDDRNHHQDHQSQTEAIKKSSVKANKLS